MPVSICYLTRRRQDLNVSMSPSVVHAYRVELDFFKGPLDLLLYLVRRDELNVRELEIGPLTQQFLKFIDVLEFIDLDMVGDFVVMASTLAEIKRPPRSS